MPSLLRLKHYLLSFTHFALTATAASVLIPPINSSTAQRLAVSDAGSTIRSNSSDDAFKPTNSTSVLTANGLTCFSQPSNPSDPRLHPIAVKDCYEALFEIVRSPIALLPKAWDPSLREFPVWNFFGTCAIGIVPRYSTSRDVFPELLVSHVAAVIIENCVKAKSYEKVGGVARVGARNEFEVCVYGRDPRVIGGHKPVLGNDTATI